MPPTLHLPEHSSRSRLPHWARFYTAMHGKSAALAVTATLYSRRLDPPHPAEVARQFFAGCDRALLGKRFFKKPAIERTQGFVVAEDWGTHPHMHGVLLFPIRPRLPVDLAEQIALAESIWKEHYASGSTDISLLTSPEKWMNYAVKKCKDPEAALIHAFDFMKR